MNKMFLLCVVVSSMAFGMEKEPKIMLRSCEQVAKAYRAVGLPEVGSYIQRHAGKECALSGVDLLVTLAATKAHMPVSRHEIKEVLWRECVVR